MVLDEPVSEIIETAAKQAIWRATRESTDTETVFAGMIGQNEQLRKELSALIIRVVQREISWTGKSMG